MMIAIESFRARHGLLKPKIKAAFHAALDFLRKKQAYLEVFLVSDAEIRRLNRRFRGKNRPTNVLSFGPTSGFPSPKTRRAFLGEIFLAPDYALRKKESLARLLVHGLLHLLGYTHASFHDKIRMEALENRIDEYLRRRKIYF